VTSTQSQTNRTQFHYITLEKGALNVVGTALSPVTFQAQSGANSGIWYGVEVNWQ